MIKKYIAMVYLMVAGNLYSSSSVFFDNMRSDLMQHMQKKNEDGALSLIRRGGEIYKCSFYKKYCEETQDPLLMLAVQYDMPTVVEALLKLGLDVNEATKYKPFDNPLERAIELGHVDVAEVLVQHGATIEPYDQEKSTTALLGHMQQCVALLHACAQRAKETDPALDVPHTPEAADNFLKNVITELEQEEQEEEFNV